MERGSRRRKRSRLGNEKHGQKEAGNKVLLNFAQPLSPHQHPQPHQLLLLSVAQLINILTSPISTPVSLNLSHPINTLNHFNSFSSHPSIPSLPLYPPFSPNLSHHINTLNHINSSSSPNISHPSIPSPPLYISPN